MGDMLSGDERAPNFNVSTQQRAQAMRDYLPSILNTISGQVLPTEQAIQSASGVLSPQQQALNAQLYQQYAPVYANAQSQAQTGADLGAIQGAGGQAVMANNALQHQIDPEYYNTRANVASKLGDLMNNPISGSESAAIERANNRGQINSGTFNTNNNANAISSAMNFGQAGRDRLGQALGMATQAMPQMRSGVDSFSQATGRGAGANPAGNVDLTRTQGLGQSAYGTGNAMMGQIAGLQGNEQNINAQRRTVYDAVNQSYSAAGSGTSGLPCCFIFLEAYHGNMPDSVRFCRDYYFDKQPKVAVGYVRMAKWLVPLMRKYTTVRKIVWNLMVKPITQQGEYLVGNNKKGNMSFKIWSIIWRLHAL